jgi:type IV pilus assembly protein PilF
MMTAETNTVVNNNNEIIFGEPFVNPLNQILLNLRHIGSLRSLLLVMLAPAFASALVGCVSSSSSIETKVPDQPGKTDSLYRAKIHTERSSEYFRLGRLAVAREAAQQAIEALPTHAPAHNMLGIVEMELKQDTSARASFEQALRLAPDDSESLNNYGWFICVRDNPKNALPYFEKALQNPVYATPERAQYNMGVCARRAGDVALAETNLRASLRSRPTFAPAMYELSEIAFTQSKIKEAEQFLARHNELVQAPGLDALYLGVRIARLLGDASAENSYAQQLRRRFPDAAQTRALGVR